MPDTSRPSAGRAGAVPVIELRGVTRLRAGQTVLEQVHLTVRRGEFLGLLGANGAGKTSLIKCLLGLDMINSGQVTIYNHPHTRPSARVRLAYLPEKFLPPGRLTGWEFLRYVCRLHGADCSPEEVGALIPALDLTLAALDQPTARLSGGTAQKLGLAACLLSGKDLLVLDEPMASLDPRARAAFRRYLMGLKQQGHTCFFSAHQLADLEQLCDRIAILCRGRLAFIGSQQACLRRFRAQHLEQAYLRCVATVTGE